MPYTRTEIDAIKAGTDLVALVSRTVELRASGRGYVGRCPFHEDRNPSFRVDPLRQTYRCFGCGERGDVVRFLQRVEQLAFPETLERLRTHASVMPKIAPFTAAPALLVTDTRNSQPGPPPTRVTEALAFAHSFFRRRLERSRRARQYLQDRGVDTDQIRRYELGLAPGGRRSLLRAAEQVGLEREILIEAGLITQKPNAVPHDFFRNRLIFPLYRSPSSGEPSVSVAPLIGFSGRYLPRRTKRRRDPSTSGYTPRYLNTATRPYSDPASWFGWPQAIDRLAHRSRESEAAADALILVEGFFDVLLTDDALPYPVLGLCGTELTPAHLDRLQHLTQSINRPAPIRLLLMFDGDASGRAALTRALETLSRHPSAFRNRTRAVWLPEGLDPADVILRRGPAAMRGLIAASTGLAGRSSS